MTFGNHGKLSCSRKPCKNEAVWYPNVRVFAKGYPLAPPMPVLLSLPLCDPCASKTDIMDVMGPECWRVIRSALHANGKVEPDASRTQLSWWPIKDAQRGNFPGEAA